MLQKVFVYVTKLFFITHKMKLKFKRLSDNAKRQVRTRAQSVGYESFFVRRN